MQKYIKNGYARKLPNEEFDKTSQRTWYLPHHPVFNKHKPNKIRTVFDAAAEHDGMSLLNNLTGILLRFRKHKVVIADDTEAMYHQVTVPKSEAITFLRQEDLSESDPEVYQMVVHIFGGKDSPCCANYALKKLEKITSTATTHQQLRVLKLFYMDDFLKSVQSEEQTKQLCQEMIKQGSI